MSWSFYFYNLFWTRNPLQFSTLLKNFLIHSWTFKYIYQILSWSFINLKKSKVFPRLWNTVCCINSTVFIVKGEFKLCLFKYFLFLLLLIQVCCGFKALFLWVLPHSVFQGDVAPTIRCFSAVDSLLFLPIIFILSIF